MAKAPPLTKAPPGKGPLKNVPKPALAVGGGVLLYLGYRYYKSKQSASSSAATTAAPTTTSANPASTDTGSGFGGGSGGGGMAGGSGSFAQKVADAVVAGIQGAGGGGSGSGTPVVDTSGGTPVVDTSSAAPVVDTSTQTSVSAPAPSQVNPSTGLRNVPTLAGAAVSEPVAKAGLPSGAGGNPSGIAGTFDLPNGVLNFQPTAALRYGQTVYYGIPNQGTAAQAKKLGGNVISGAALQKKGIGAKTGALYLAR